MFPPLARLLPLLLMQMLLAATPALAQDQAARLRQDAERHLRPCDAETEPAQRAECGRVRALFLDAYGRARRGDPMGQRVVAELLQGRHPGMRRNLVEACAWRTVVILQGHAQLRPQDPERWGEDCSRLAQQDHLAAHARAQQWLQEIGPTASPAPAAPARPAMAATENPLLPAIPPPATLRRATTTERMAAQQR